MTVLVLLWLAVSVCFWIAIIKPSVFSKLAGGTATRKILGSAFFIVGTILFFTIAALSPPPSKTTNSSLRATQSPQSIKLLSQRSKTAGCRVAATPDNTCSPGSIISTATKEKICTPGYSKSVRDVSEQTKEAVFQEYGIDSHPSGEYEVDHLVSLELGGSNDISNLWPEAANPLPGFHQKDALENRLHSDVCSGKIDLAVAQQQIASDWLTDYNNDFASKPAPAPAPQPVATTPAPPAQRAAPAPAPEPQAAPQPTGERTGAVCRDGTPSTATGSGACSHHGGVDHWTY